MYGRAITAVFKEIITTIQGQNSKGIQKDWKSTGSMLQEENKHK